MGRVASLFGMTAIGALLSAGPALSAPQLVSLDAQQEFRIPSQPLDSALLLFSRQTGLQIISSAPVVANKVAPGLTGVKTPRQAIEALLRGSDLSYVVAGNTVTIVPAAPPAAMVPATLQTPDVVRAGPFNAAPARLFKIADQTSQGPSADAAAPVGPGRPPEQLTVTGSRIVRNGYSAPTPVTVITADELLATTPTDIGDALNKLPEFSPQFTAQTNTGSAAPGGNYLNLRGLGQNRTLVLLDGVRVPSTNTTGTVDVNTLPSALVSRVEVVTGGASAIYGSDAVGGVVNYILNTNFNGLKGSAQSGISTYGDAPSDKFNLVFGTHVLNNGHFEVSYEHAATSGINQSDRGYTDQAGFAGAGTAASPYYWANNLRMSTTTLGGYIQTATAGAKASVSTATLTSQLVGQQFLNGGVAPFINGATATTSAAGGLQVGGSGAYYTGGQLVKPTDTDNLFTRFDYQLPHNIKAYAQVAAGLSQSNYLIPPAAITATLYSGNPYLPASVQALLTPASTPTAPASLAISSLAQNLSQMQQTHEWESDVSTTFGASGELFNDSYKWITSYTHGQGINHVETDNNINTSHFYAALDAVKGPGGAPVCNVSTTSSAALYPGCVPLNFIGYGNESPAALAYIMQNTTYDIINRTDELTASLSGTAFNDWAGPVSVAINGEQRWLSLQETTDAAPAAPLLTGLRQTWTGNALKGATPGTLFLGTTNASQRASESVWEVGGETVVPLLRDFTGVKNLEFSGALRYTDYSVSGRAITWKAGLNYQPVDDVRFRVTESRDIRAPTLYDLFQAASVTPVTITGDGLNGQTYTVNEYAGGNSALQPEVATTNTIGVIYSPSWLRGFRISVDSYLINIRNAIGQSLPAIGTTGINDDIAFCAASGGTSPYCKAIPRPLGPTNNSAANNISAVYSYGLNLAEQYVRGVDLETSYGFDLRDVQVLGVQPKWDGHIDLRMLMTYAPTDVTISAPGQPAAGSPLTAPLVTRATTTINYSLGGFRATWEIIYTDQYRYATPTVTPIYYVNPIAPATIVDNVNFSYRFKAQSHDLQAFFTVTNLFNQSPSYLAATPAAAVPGSQTPLNAGISPLGRYFTGGLRFSF